MNKIIYAAALAAVICLSIGAYSDRADADLQENITRLHIIADSDSAEAQSVKLAVRDAVLSDARENGMSADAARFKKIADDTLLKNGFTYTSEASFGKFYFPRKSYKGMTFPAGEYRGLRIILGSGNGRNWWCVMNPPLCFTESAEGELSENGRRKLKDSLNSETYDIITNKPEIRFKIVEIVNELRKKSK